MMNVRIAPEWGMQHQPPQWLLEAVESGPRGFQADLARQSGIAKDKISKVINGVRALKHNEAEVLRQAIEALKREPIEMDEPTPLSAPEGTAVVRKVVANTRGRGRRPELVFLLSNGGYFVFQMDQQGLADLRAALDQMEAVLPELT